MSHATVYNREDIYQIPLPKEIKIVVSGSGGVGKSAITIQYVQSIFVQKYDPTIEESYRLAKDFGQKNVLFEILDTAGTEKFTAMRDLYMKNGQGFIYVYSIISESTFNDVPDIIEQTRRVKDKDDFPMVIVGNKLDLDPEVPEAGLDRVVGVKPEGGSVGTRAVSTARGQELAQKFNGPFLEVSAKTNYNVELVFVNVLNQFSRIHGASIVGNERQRKKRCNIL